MRFIYIIIFISSVLRTYTQNQLDLLYQKIQTVKTDTAKAGNYYQLAIIFATNSELDSARKYGELALELSAKEKYQSILYLSAFDLCKTHIYMGNYVEAIKAGELAVNNAPELAKPSMFNRLGAAYYYNEDYENAFDSYSKSLLHHGDNESKVLAYNGMGNVLYAQNKLNEALNYYKLGYKISKETYLKGTNKLDVQTQADCLLNLANVYDALNNSSEAIKLFKNAISIYELKKDEASKAQCQMNLGIIFTKQKNYHYAYLNFNQSLVIFKKFEDKENTILCLINLGYASFKEHKLKEAELFLQQGITLAKELGSLDYLKNCYDNIAPVYAEAGNYKKAYEYNDLFNKVKDSLNTKLFNERIAQQETIYKTKEKEAEIGVLNTEKEKEKQRRYFLTAIIVVIVIVSFFIYRQYRLNKNLNKELSEKNNAIENKNKEIEIQKTEITDSINYAKRIQSSLLPIQEEIDQVLPQSFVLYKPKAIVSGDFYFVSHKADKIIVAVVDCTGHGVPGAFMSIIGHNILSQLIDEKGITKPEEILNNLHVSIRRLLHQESFDSAIRDGMDICLISIDKSFNYLDYAGANRPLYHFREGILNEIKSNKFPIGGLQLGDDRHFKNNRIDLQKGDVLYMFSDGYADQFGGAEGKKFMVKNMKDVFAKIYSFAMDEQKNMLDSTFVNWHGNLEQIDDVLVMGIKI